MDTAKSQQVPLFDAPEGAAQGPPDNWCGALGELANWIPVKGATIPNRLPRCNRPFGHTLSHRRYTRRAEIRAEWQ